MVDDCTRPILQCVGGALIHDDQDSVPAFRTGFGIESVGSWTSSITFGI